jgi:hypothetical protein
MASIEKVPQSMVALGACIAVPQQVYSLHEAAEIVYNKLDESLHWIKDYETGLRC